MDAIQEIIQEASLVVIGFTLLYVFTLTFAGIRETRKSGIRLSRQEALINATPNRHRAVDYDVFFLLPCLNEEKVIGATIDALLESQQRGTIVVIDDGSDDATAEIARSKGENVVVHSRQAPDARQGKGMALNAGLQVVREIVRKRDLSTRSVLICVMDADGRMTPNAMDWVGPMFDDPAVGGVQLVVRIRNRHSLVTRFQDMEFWAMSGVGQIGRMATGTVSMGGNGQFTRLFALDEIGERPWSQSLTEDLDLGISLLVNGWQTTSTIGAYVTQQGLDDLEALLRQRTRWYQGHMQAITRFGELLRSKHLSNLGFFELGSYLAVPWVITLPWSIIQQYILLEVLTGRGVPSRLLSDGPLLGRLAFALLWYLASFAPHLFWGWLYWRRAEEVSVGRAMLMCHLMLPWSYLSYAAAWRAAYRMVTGQRGWIKTARSTETGDLAPAAEAHSAPVQASTS